jgi:predicted MFS family arabinose efflux permease
VGFAQAAYLLQALGLALLVFMDHRGQGLILLLAVLLGIVTAFDLPGRQVLVAQVVDREDLPNAIALQSALFHGSRILGPALTGLVIAASHEGWCFLLNATSYLAALGTLAALRPRPPADARPSLGAWANMTEGFSHLRRHRPTRLIVLLMGLIVALGMPFTALMPAIARSSLGVGARETGWLMGFSGLGATLAALMLASRKEPKGLERVMVGAGLAFALLLAVFSHTRSLYLAYGILPVASFFLVSLNTASNTLTQTMAPDALRGRVMAVYGMVFMGALPLGTLGVGFLAGPLGLPWALSLGAFGCLLSVLIFWARFPASESP